MKNIFKYFAAAALVLSLGACEELVDNTVTIDAAPDLVYVNSGTDNTFSALVVHRIDESTGSFETMFPVKINTSVHPAMNASLAYDASLVEKYNADKGTDYAVLPEEYLVLENTTLSFEENALQSLDSVKVSLSQTADLSKLTERTYIAPIKVTSDDMGVSEVLNAAYLLVNTENYFITPISSEAELQGYPAGGKSLWTASLNGFESLFDGSTSTYVGVNRYVTTMVMDMKSARKVAGLRIRAYLMTDISIEYSLDGMEYFTAGTAASGDYYAGGTSSRAGNFCIAFGKILDARYLRISFNMTSSSSSRRRVYEIDVMEKNAEGPIVYAEAGGDNKFAGSVVHHVSGQSFASLSASFNVKTTVASASGFSVSAEVDNSYIDSFNKSYKTSYVALDPSYVKIEGAPCAIAANATQSSGQIKVSLVGNPAGLTNANGYLVPLKLSAAGAATAESRGVVYLEIPVMSTDAKFRTGFTAADMTGTQVADRSAWTILASDEGGIYNTPTTYDVLFDGNTRTYLRTWGGPIQFTVDMGQEYDMTGFIITARTDNNTYASYQPNSVIVKYSLDGNEYTDLGTVSKADGNLVAANPSSYMLLYESVKVRYLMIEASYGSNMGCGEFNIYVK